MSNDDEEECRSGSKEKGGARKERGRSEGGVRREE
jgi:hypothetical protein